MNENALYMLATTQQDGNGSKWQWSLFGNNGSTAPTPPDASGDEIVSKSMEMIKGMEGGNVIDNNSTWVSYANVGIKIAVALMLIFLVISLVVQAMQLAMYGDNPGMRSKTLENIKRTFIAAAILGGLTTIIGLCFNIFT